MSASSRNGGGKNCSRSFTVDLPPVEEDDCSGYVTLCCEGGNLGGTFGAGRQNGGLNGNAIKNIRKSLKQQGMTGRQIIRVLALYRLAYQKMVAEQERQRALASGATQANGKPANCGSEEGYTDQSDVVYRLPDDLFSSFSLQVDLEVRRGREFYTIYVNGRELVSPRVDSDGNYVLINNRPIHDVNLSGSILTPIRIQDRPRALNSLSIRTLTEENEEDCNPVGTVDEEGEADCDDPCPCPCEEGLSEMDCCMGPWKDSPPALGGGEHLGATLSRGICSTIISMRDAYDAAFGRNSIIFD